jgi:hypothetical protein
MTMHGAFWRFPRDFSRARSGGISPLSNYLRVIGDFARWQDRVVFGCDDSAKSEFLNKRSFKNEHATPPQSNSNLWFVAPAHLANLGPAIGRGSVWLREDVKAGAQSDPFLFSGFDLRMLHLTHHSEQPTRIRIETDDTGNNTWRTCSLVALPAKGSVTHTFPASQSAAWIRLVAEDPIDGVSASFHFRNRDHRQESNGTLFEGFASAIDPQQQKATTRQPAHLRSLSAQKIGFSVPDGGFYEMDTALRIHPVENEALRKSVDLGAPIEVKTIHTDAASIVIEEDGKRFRLPSGIAANTQASGAANTPAETAAAPERVCREVATERDLLNVGGTFFELPARNAQGLAKIRPIATHNLAIHDYASQFGLMLVTGKIIPNIASSRIFESEDKAVRVWAGVIDDLWQLGKPRGTGGPWRNSAVQAGVPSDPYLMSGYDRKEVALSHTAAEPVAIRLEADIDGTGLWVPYQRFSVPPAMEIHHTFAEAFGAYWIRAVAEADCGATVQFTYR